MKFSKLSKILIVVLLVSVLAISLLLAQHQKTTKTKNNQ